MEYIQIKGIERKASPIALGTWAIDFYQVHWLDESVPLEESAAFLAGFQREGKIRAIGVKQFFSCADGSLQKRSSFGRHATALQSLTHPAGPEFMAPPESKAA
jgi:aryl-alcohol dehydrogenase-like predicted oxidoreductase